MSISRGITSEHLPSYDRAIYKMRPRGWTVNKLGVGSDPSWSAKGKLAFI